MINPKFEPNVYNSIRIDKDGKIMISDNDIERIAQRVIELLRLIDAKN